MDSTVVLVGAIALIHAGLLRGFLRVVSLPEEVYFRPNILPSALKTPRIVVFTLVVTALPLLRFGATSWANFAWGNQLKWFIFSIAAIIAWTYATYSYNYYYNQSHIADRVLLLVWCLGILLHPLFVSLFLVHALLVLKQFHYPIGYYTWTDKRVLFDILILFSAAITIGAFGADISRPFVFLLFTVHATNYLLPGIGKLQIRWPKYEKIYYLSLCAYMNGWRIVPEETLLRAVPLLRRSNGLFIAGTLVIELLPLFIWAHPSLPIAVFALAILLHVGIFSLSGILFWKWILLNFALIGLIASISGSAATYAGLFGWRSVVLSVVLFALARWLFSTFVLAWYDTPLAYTFDLTAFGESGKRYSIPRGLMSPYDVIFAQNRFYHTLNQNVAVGVYGTVYSVDILDNIVQARHHPTAKAQIDALGDNLYSAEQTDRLENFLKQYFTQLNRQPDKKTWLAKVSAPHHILSVRKSNAYSFEEPIARVEMQMLQTVFDGESFRTLADETVLAVDVETTALSLSKS